MLHSLRLLSKGEVKHADVRMADKITAGIQTSQEGSPAVHPGENIVCRLGAEVWKH